MHEMILCKLGEVVLKGLNRRSFEDKLMSNVNRRVSKCGNFRVYSKQSTIYVEPKDDECDIEAAFESCKKIFGIKQGCCGLIGHARAAGGAELAGHGHHPGLRA